MNKISDQTTLNPHDVLKQSLKNYETPKSTYMIERIFPTLIPGLVLLLKAVKRSGTDLIVPITGEVPFDEKSVPYQIYLSRYVMKILTFGLEKCYRTSPEDEIDFIADYLFQNSADDFLDSSDPGNEAFDIIHPLHWLAQYLYRHNPKYIGKSNNQRLDSLLVPFKPSKRPNPGAPTPERINSPRTYPPEKEEVFETENPTGSGKLAVSNSQDNLIIGSVVSEIAKYLEIPADKANFNVKAIRHTKNNTITFKAQNESTGQNFQRTIGEVELQWMLNPEDRWRTSTVKASRDAMKKVTLVPLNQDHKIMFEKESSSSLCYKGTKRILDKTYIVEMFYEPEIKAETPALEDGDKENNNKSAPNAERFRPEVTIRFKLYDPETTLYYECSCTDVLTLSSEAFSLQVNRLIDYVTMINLPNKEEKASSKNGLCALMPLIENAETILNGHECIITCGFTCSASTATAKGNRSILTIIEINNVKKEVYIPVNVIEKSFPRFASKDKQLCSVTDPVIVDILSKIAIDGVKKDDAGKIVDFDATSNLPQKMRKPVFAKKFDTALLLDASFAKLTPLFNQSMALTPEETEARDKIWKMRRNQTLERRKVERCRRQRAEDSNGGVFLLRRGQKINGINMIVSIEVLCDSINGKLKFSAYNPINGETYSTVLPNQDTRKYDTLRSGKMITGDAEKEIVEICSRLKLEDDEKNSGTFQLVLWESSVTKTKIRRSFNRLNRDKWGNASKQDIISMLKFSLEDQVEYLKRSSHKVLANESLKYFEGALQRTIENAPSRVSFDCLLGILEIE